MLGFFGFGWNEVFFVMSLRISGKQMEVGSALTSRITSRVNDAISKYFGHGFSGHVTLEKQGAFVLVDCRLHLDSGVTLQAGARETDANTSFDRACERIEKRLRRYKRKLRNHHHGDTDSHANLRVMEIPPETAEVSEVEADYAPAIIAESQTPIQKLSVADAVMQLELTDDPIKLFENASGGGLNIVYRRADGNIGWIDPS